MTDSRAQRLIDEFNEGAALAAEGDVAELALKELERTVVLLMPVTGHKKIKRFNTIRAALKRLQELENKADLSPTPMPEEAANPWKDALIDALVCAFLLNEENQSDPRRALHDLISWEVQLARDPLINPPAHPTPVPVSEPPKPEDLDTEGYCWWFDTDAWIRLSPLSGFAWGKITHWLPAHALPLPQGEVE